MAPALCHHRLIPGEHHMTDRPATGLARLYVRSLFAGFAVVVMTHTGTDEIMHSTGIIPRGAMWNPWHNLLALTYRCLFTVAGGFVTAWLAPRARMRHVVILAVIGTLGGFAGVMMSWDMNLGPRWYPIALAVTAFPAVWLGGWLYLRRYERP
jgi:hypothetical protein